MNTAMLKSNHSVFNMTAHFYCKYQCQINGRFMVYIYI